MSRIPPAVAAAVIERANGTCEAHVELVGPAFQKLDFHHRQARGMGGSTGRDLDTVENLLYLHAACHAYWHQHPVQARALGYIVSQYASTP